MEEIKVKKVNDDVLESSKNYVQKIKDGDKVIIAQIDQLVHGVYGLTEEEIRIEDGKRE